MVGVVWVRTAGGHGQECTCPQPFSGTAPVTSILGDGLQSSSTEGRDLQFQRVKAKMFSQEHASGQCFQLVMSYQMSGLIWHEGPDINSPLWVAF